MIKFYWFVLGALCVWRVTHFIHAEDGPWNLVSRVRAKATGPFWRQLVDCFYCLSLWVAAPLAYWLGVAVNEKLLLWPALSAVAILLERSTREPEAAPAQYVEESEGPDELLRP